MCCQLLVCVPLLYPLGSRQEKASQTFHIANLYEPTVLLTSHYLETMAITGGKTFFNYIQGYSNSFKKKKNLTRTLYVSLQNFTPVYIIPQQSQLSRESFFFFSPYRLAVCTHRLQNPSSLQKINKLTCCK